MSTYTIGMTCSMDRSESYQEEDVMVSSQCKIAGTRHVGISKSFGLKVTYGQGDVITVVKNCLSGLFSLVDYEGNYDPTWYLSDHFSLENVKFVQGLVIRGTLKDVSYYSNKNYCKQLEINKDFFFVKNNVPVMSAKTVLLETNGRLWARGIK